MHIKIGTRGSKLALWQAHYIQDLLIQSGISTSIIEISTKGDKILDVSLAKIGSKGLFTEELEEMLLANEIDIAVHSAKDVQSSLRKELELIAFTEREEVNDVLVSFKNIDINSENAALTIGTSSTRRVAFLKHHYPHLSIVDMRGNLQTRYEKMKAGACDAMILAYAGVHRMNFDSTIVKKLSVLEFTPPVGQGTIAIESAVSLDPIKRMAIRNAVNHLETEICLLAERMFLKVMQGGCSVPTFAYARHLSELELVIEAGIISLDGKNVVRESVTFDSKQAESIGELMAQKVLSSGGDKILNEIRSTLLHK